ncbi:tetratricopeptide repeat protein [Ensifer sp. MJa1]|uniref:tetratricopeptide repeat protein n=1 Tax=Ensifer sp. MJa1 TaxID=2919888 RepID=UPI00300A1FC8
MATVDQNDVGTERTCAAPSDAEVLTQLDRIRRSAEFDAPDRDRKFLAYVVEETLAGRGERIKAYSIATEVFGRDSSFDPQTDPAVRIEAGRIRRALERYYLVAGRADPIVISIPKGAYVPTFKRRVDAPPQPEAHATATVEPESSTPRFSRQIWIGAAAILCVAGGLVAHAFFVAMSDDTIIGHAPPKIPRLVVKPFEDLSGTPQSAMMLRGLTDEVVSNIAKFKEIVVVTSESADDQRPADGGPTFALEARVRLDGDRLRLGVRLIQRSDGSVVWANTYDERLRARDMIDLQAETAGVVANAVARPHGAVFQASAREFKHAVAAEWRAYACTLTYYDHRDDFSPQGHAFVQDCLQRTVRQFPTYATAWALLSMTYVDAFRYQLEHASSATLDRAAEAAARAEKLDPQDTRALEAQMLTLFFQGEIDAALAVGARARAINPNDTDLSGEYGLRLALSGQWDPGCRLVDETVARNPGPAGYFEAARAVCSYFSGDYVAAERWVRVAGLHANPLDRVLLLAILGKLGKTEQAKQQRNWLEANTPGLLDNIPRDALLQLRRPEDQKQWLDGLRKAGIPIAEAAYEQARSASSYAD